MIKIIFYILIAICLIQPLKAQSTILINYNDTWNYQFVSETNEYNWGNVEWDNISYSSFNWNNAIWQNGLAPFGNWNWYQTYSTYWNITNDLALRKIINIDGNVSNLDLIVNVDDRFALFINGHLIVKTTEAGAFTYQYNDLNATYFIQGNNYIDILADDIRKYDWIDMHLTADISPIITPPVPEPSSLLLEIICFLGFLRLKIRIS